MMKWSIISCLFVVLIGINTYIARSTVSELTVLQQSISKTSDIMVALDELHISVLTAESGQRGYLLMQEESYLQHYQLALEKMQSKLDRAKELDSDIEGQGELIAQVIGLIELKIDELTSTVGDVKAENYSQVRQTLASHLGKNLYAKIRNIFDQMSINENEYRANLSQTLEAVTAESRTTFIISLITSLLMVLGIFLLARMNIRFQKQRQREIEEQNAALFFAVEERTKELSLYSEELKRSNRELEDFAFVASHDLQEPLRKIQTFGDRLTTQFGEGLGDKGQDYLQRMQSAAIRMSALISDLLEFSRITTRGKAFEDVDLNSLVADCIEDLSVKIEEQQAKIDIDELPQLQGDPSQLRQLFTNLLSNALKFSMKGQVPNIHIKVLPISRPPNIETPNLDNWFEISVQDNGIGFDQAYADKIFAPFQRLHTRTEYLGTGIGLSICRRIVERHNGEISASSEAGKGAKFVILLPATNVISTINPSEINHD